MKISLVILSCTVLLLASSCKRVCYNCDQYCAYCISGKDTTLVTKVCAIDNRSTVNVDKALIMLRDSGYDCNMLTDETTVCDGKNGIDEAITYHLKLDYFCKQKPQ